MRCHFHTDKTDGNKYLIPECWPVVHSNDITDCICRKPGIKVKREKESVEIIVSNLKTDSIITGLLF